MHGWRGNYEGFAKSALFDVHMDGEAKFQEIVTLSSMDVAMRIYYVIPTTFAIVLPQELDQERFLKAAGLALKSYPALGARLRLDPLPASLDLTKPCFPVKFAVWPGGSADRFQYDYQWESSADAAHFIPYPPFAHGIEVEKAMNGQEPLFTLQVTTLGDGATVIAATWIHILMDAHHAVKVLNAVAAAYRELGNSSEAVESPYLPPCNVERNTWPWDLERLPLKSSPPAGDDTTRSEEGKTRILHSQDGLLDGPACVAKETNFRSLFGPLAAQKEEWTGDWSALLTIQLKKEDIQSLKADMKSHPLLTDVPFSTNDVILALTWLVRCDTQGLPRPTKGPKDSTRVAFVAMDASASWPEMARDSYLGNLLHASPVAIISEGNADADPDAVDSLKSALAATIAAIRKTIKDAREPAKLKEAVCTQVEAILPSETFLATLEAFKANGVDIMLTNWNQARYKDIDFGSGPTTILLGHFGLQRFWADCIMAVSDDALGVSFPLHNKEGLQRLESSPLLPVLAPHSGLLTTAASP